MLTLVGNRFTQSGKDVLTKVIYDDSSLNAVSDSNHVCTIEGEAFYSVGHVNLHRNDDPRSRARKIFQLLRERNKEGTNVHHLEREIEGTDTLKVVPYVLNAVQIYGEQWMKLEKWDWDTINGTVKDAAKLLIALSIAYELLRSWNVTGLSGGAAAQQESLE